MAPSQPRDLDARIRERAYHIWQQEGRPPGRSQVHWDMARELVAIEESQSLATKPNPMTNGLTRDPITGEPVDVGALQGETQSHPAPRREPVRRRTGTSR